jgi:hypothetical protein
MSDADKRYDIFITHAWRYHDDWMRAGELLDAVPGLKWRNFSVPWHDPAMDANSEVGGRFIREWLESQIIPVDGVVLLGGVYAVRSARHWIELELEFARRHRKPVIGLPPVGANEAPAEVRKICDAVVGWDGAALIAALRDAGSRIAS